MGQEVHEVRPVAATHTLERSAGKAAATVAVPVDWPASQLAQAVVDAVLNLAMAQAVQLVAPVAASVLVTEPAPQLAQAMVEAVLYVPAAHGVQVVAPAPVSVFVTEPAGQGVHPGIVVPSLE